MLQGRIIKSLAGFYYVESQNQLYTCRARGKFRKENMKPVVGDICDFEIDENND